MKYLKYFVITIVVITVLLLIFMPKPSATEKTAKQAKSDSALVEVRKNSQVIEAFVTDANVLYVSVVNKGKDYNQFAQYMCNVMRANGSKPYKVRIREAGTIGHPDADTYGVPLGEWECQ